MPNINIPLEPQTGGNMNLGLSPQEDIGFDFTISPAQTIPAPVDATLTISGQAADAKATGDRIAEVENEIPELDSTLTAVGEAAEAVAVGNALALKADASDLADVVRTGDIEDVVREDDIEDVLREDDVVDSLNSDDDTKPLSAKQGKALNTSKLSNVATDIKAAIIDMVYPVGSIYTSTVNTSPATFMGGTWESISGRFLFAENGSHAAGSTGGSETVTLTVQQMPSHRHPGYDGASTQKMPVTGGMHYFPTTMSWIGQGETLDLHQVNAMELVGGGQAHDNMPPYLTVYMWKRTA